MTAETQTWVALAIVVLATALLVRAAWRRGRRKNGCGCGTEGCGPRLKGPGARPAGLGETRATGQDRQG